MDSVARLAPDSTPKKALSTHFKNQVPLLLFSIANVPDSTNQFDECLVTSYVDFP